MSRKAQSNPLLDQFIDYFNRRRNAGIERIADSKEVITVHYFDERKDVPIRDLLSWTDLFNKLDQLHPPK